MEGMRFLLAPARDGDSRKNREVRARRFVPLRQPGSAWFEMQARFTMQMLANIDNADIG